MRPPPALLWLVIITILPGYDSTTCTPTFAIVGHCAAEIAADSLEERADGPSLLQVHGLKNLARTKSVQVSLLDEEPNLFLCSNAPALIQRHLAEVHSHSWLGLLASFMSSRLSQPDVNVDPCLLGLTKVAWATIAALLSMVVVLACIPFVLIVSRRRPPGQPLFGCCIGQQSASQLPLM
mmetsp:Transcript_22612/g.51736  ORF Transcript_22612/g.51736 Transcript_22612/m.51736 type:complete len:180 (+) Transcript_22612:50-589(+)